MSFWDTPDGRQALAARAMDRAPLYEAMREPEPMAPSTCEFCGYVYAVHDNSDPTSVLPFGCPPSEQVAIERWGRAS